MTGQYGDAIDLRTAQNRVHSFLVAASDDWRRSGLAASLASDPDRQRALEREAEALLFRLLGIPAELAGSFFMGIADSGKRSIEVLVQSLLNDGGRCLALTAENYVGHNKWSANATAERYKGVPLVAACELELGAAVTSANGKSLAALHRAIEEGAETLYLAWNSTSIGIEERVEDLVAYRNQVGSPTLIVADASSLPLVSGHWRSIDASTLPDAFFFSFRKHSAIPYDGPQDEIEQMQRSGAVLVVRERAVARAREVAAGPVYGVDLRSLEDARAPAGEKYVLFLLRLHALLDRVLSGGGAALDEIDAVHSDIKRLVFEAFDCEGRLGRLGFSLLADPAAQSRTSYVVQVPESLQASQVIRVLEDENGITVSPALHPLANTKHHNLLRFGVYSATPVDDVVRLLDSLENLA